MAKSSTSSNVAQRSVFVPLPLNEDVQAGLSNDDQKHFNKWYHKDDEIPAVVLPFITNEKVFMPLEATEVLDDYDTLGKADLVAACEARDLPHSGSKEELIAVLREADGRS